MFVVSRFTAATSEPTLERFFPATPATAITMP
jgi:hypothetical protein